MNAPLPPLSSFPEETHPEAIAVHAAHRHQHPGFLVTLQSLSNIVVVALFIMMFIAQPFRIPSESMEQTLLVGDFLLVNKQVFAPADAWHGLLPYRSLRRGDIIVFHDPADSGLHLVKRVIGMPGDHLRLVHGRVFINDKPLDEPYAVYIPRGPDYYRDNFPRRIEADSAIQPYWWMQMLKLVENGELIIPSDSYFAMGDNRNDSEDSRYWGFVKRDEIVGSPFLVYFSLNHGPDEAAVPLPVEQGQSKNEHSTWLDWVRWNRVLKIVW